MTAFRKIVTASLLVLLFAGQGWAATYYVDQRNGSAGDGSIDNPWKSLDSACAGTLPSGNHTIEVAKNSGPYLASDLSSGFIHPEDRSGSLVFNFNGNSLIGDIDVNNTAGYTWSPSSVTGYYYLTNTLGGATSLPQTKSCVVNGDWTAESTNLFQAVPDTRKKNGWGWGDLDSLGFSTLYVKLEGNLDPRVNKDIAVYCPLTNFVIKNESNQNLEFNNAYIRGSNLVLDANYGQGVNSYYRCTFYNTDLHAVNPIVILGKTVTYAYNKFIDCGHRAIAPQSGANGTINFYNNTIYGAHLVALVTGNNTSLVFNMRNNLSYKLYAGGLDLHASTNLTLNEDHNQWHIDSESNHGNTMIGFNGELGTTALWSTTHATDLPASRATNIPGDGNPAGCGTDPIVRSDTDFRLRSSSPCINAGATIEGLVTDFDDKKVPYSSAPDIGAYEYRPTVGPFRW